MRTATTTAPSDQVSHIAEHLMSQLTQGREWATPGVEASLKKVVAALDAGIESASPRIQTGLQRLADELAGGVETLAPRVQESLHRVAPKVVAPVMAPARATSRRTASGKAWLIAGVAAVGVTAGVAVLLLFRRADEEPVPSVDVQRARGVDPDLHAGPTEAQP